MSLPPNAIVAAPAKVAATEKCQPRLTLSMIAEQAKHANVFVDPEVIAMHLIDEHDLAPQVLVQRFKYALPHKATGPMRPRLARVRFERHRFYFDPEGRWSVVAPILRGTEIINWAAFDADNDDMRKTLRPSDFAVGLEDASWEAGYHPHKRLLILYSVWSWLQNGCTGALPTNWNAMAIYLLQERYSPLFTSKLDGQKAEAELRRASVIKPGFVRQEPA